MDPSRFPPASGPSNRRLYASQRQQQQQPRTEAELHRPPRSESSNVAFTALQQRPRTEAELHRAPRFESTNSAFTEQNCRHGLIAVHPKFPAPPSRVNPAAVVSISASSPGAMVGQHFDVHVRRCRDELQQVGTERLLLQQNLSPSDSPGTSPAGSGGRSSGAPGLKRPSSTGVAVANKRDHVGLLIAQVNSTLKHKLNKMLQIKPSHFLQVDQELRELGGCDGRGRLTCFFPALFPQLDSVMTSLVQLKSIKKREEELSHRARVVGQQPPSKEDSLKCKLEMNASLAALAEHLKRIKNHLASLA
jgi:hypothetical protein